jgi:N-methylhydantoinase A
MSAAEGVHRVINAQMAEGMRLVSVRRGVDPRGFAILAFGGAAGLHVSAIARQLGLARVVVPRLAAVLSAWGMLTSDLRYEVARSHLGDAGRLDGPALRAVYDELEAEGRRRLASATFEGEVRVLRTAEMRYGEQIFEVSVSLDGIDWTAADLLEQIAAAFHRRHEELYTYSLPDQEAVLVNARVAVIGLLPAPPHEPLLPERPPAAPRDRRRAWLGAWTELPVFAFEALAPGQSIAGPAIVESPTTTVLLRQGDRARATTQGWLDIAVAAT